MNIGIYVGSFDPVHLGHIKIINYLLSNKIIDRSLIIPTGSYWDKSNLTDMKDRINMLKIFESDKILIDSHLIKYEYTHEILNELRNKYNNATLYLIIGADNLEKFHLWNSIDEILKYKIIVINRNGIETEKYINRFNEKNSFLVVKGLEDIDISSTDIRKRIKEKKGVSNLLDKRVEKYIKERNLYGG